MTDDIDEAGRGMFLVPGGSDAGEIAYRPLGGRRIRVLAHGSPGKRELLVHGEHLYWSDTDDGSLTRIHKHGGVPVVLATDQRGIGPIAISDGCVTWGRHYLYGNDGLYRMPLEGGEPRLIRRGRVDALSVLGDAVAWTSIEQDGLGSVHLTRASDGMTVPLAAWEKLPRSVVLDEHDVYWASYGQCDPSYFEDGSVARASRTMLGDRELLAHDRSMPSSLVLEGDAATGALYWCEAQTTYGPGPWMPGRIWRRDRATGAARALCAWRTQDGVIAVDATHVYFLASFGGSMWRVSKDGGEPEPLLAPARDRMLWSTDLAVDDQCVYWTSNSSERAGGAVFRMAKAG